MLKMREMNELWQLSSGLCCAALNVMSTTSLRLVTTGLYQS